MVEIFGLQNRRLRSALSLIVALLLIGSISYLGVHTYQASHAASGPSIYASPASANLVSGSTLSITIRENSGLTAVNGVQTTFGYDPNSLQYIGLNEGSTFPFVAATSTNNPGVIRIARASISGTTATGDNPIVTLNFKVIGSAGQSAITFDKSSSLLVRASDHIDVLENVGGGNFAISVPPTEPKQPATGSSGVKPSLSISPADGSYPPGSTISAVVQVAAHDTPVTSLEAVVNYPVAQLRYIGVTEGTAFVVQQRTSAANGMVDIIRGIAGGSNGLTGDNPVVTVNFKVLGSSGVAPLSFGSISAAFDASGTGTNVIDLNRSTGAQYRLSATAVAPTPTPKIETAPTVISPAQAINFGFKPGQGSAYLITAASGTQSTQLSGTVNLAPVIINNGSNDSISKVEYYLDDKLISTQKNQPYVYRFNTTTQRNGSYTIRVRTYYRSGVIDSRTDTVLIQNKVTLAYVLRNYTSSLMAGSAILVALVILVWKLIMPRFTRLQAQAISTDPDLHFRRSDVPVAADPTVVSPAGMPEPIGEASAFVSSAAMTTPALPMSAPVPQVTSPPNPVAPTPIPPQLPISGPSAVSPAPPVSTVQPPMTPPAPITRIIVNDGPVPQTAPQTFPNIAEPTSASSSNSQT